MNFRALIRPSHLLALACLTLTVSIVARAGQSTPSQETPLSSPMSSDEEARGAFIKNRDKKPAASSAGKQTAQSQPSKPPVPAGNRNSKPVRRPPVVETSNSPAPETAPAPVRIGLGFTLYQRNERGEAVRVNPAKTFRKDDLVRFVIEPNIDGYLYIFYRENETEPMMIFPDPRLHEGDNKITAHVPCEVPSRHSRTPWFVFDEKPAVENFLIVVSKTPLVGVPTGDSLVKYCLAFGDDCAWKPTQPQYDPVIAQANQPKIVSQSKTLGQLQAATEDVAIAKGFKLKPQEPEPTIVQMNVSATLNLLVMKTQLIHQ